MLVLSRKIDESIRIGDGVTVKILSMENGQVKIGIDAPKEVRILRAEILEEVRKSNAEAAKTVKIQAVKAASMIKKDLPGGRVSAIKSVERVRGKE